MSSLTRDLRRAVDPAVILEDSGRTPDPWQYAMLAAPAKQISALCARQIGKTECLACKGIHRAAYHPGSVVGIVAPTLRQSARLLARARALLPFLRDVCRPINDAKTTLLLDNGSRLEAWPGGSADNIRGDTLDLLLCDEASWISTAVWLAVQPMLTMSRGDVFAASTPGGPAGWFYDAWVGNTDGDSGAADIDWLRLKVTAPECPRYRPEDLERARRALGEDGYAVEFMCEWRQGANQVFSSLDIARILGREPHPDDLNDDDDKDQLTLPELGDLLAAIRSNEAVTA
jgi:hypothetical protein